jgi:hypothetical protein
MRQVLIGVLALFAVALIQGVAGVGASTQTVARHLLLIRERGQGHVCLSQIPEPPLGRAQKLSDRFQLRAPGKGNHSTGPLLARGIRSTWTTTRHCGINVTFRVRSTLGTFSFYDATTGDIWFRLRLGRLVGGRWERTVIALKPR